MKEVRNFIPKKQTVDELLKQLKEASFNARTLGKAVDILEEMIRDENCTKFLGLSGALVPAGMQECITEMIKNKWIDIIVSTGANITHDLAIVLGGEEYLQCEPSEVDDKEMREKGISRIYDIASPDKTSISFERNIQKILKTVNEGSYSTYELLEKIGKNVDKNSITGLAAEKDVKIIVPAFFDSILGMQVWMHTQERKIVIDERKDLDFLINLNYGLKEKEKNTGALILGGGVPKNYILQSVIIPDKPHKYVVQITTDTPHHGGLSGATLEEALSWGKVNSSSRTTTCYCDTTIALPIVVSALKERL